MARTSALIVPVQPVLHRVLCSNEKLPNAPKYYEMHQNMSLGSKGWIGCVRCEKFRCDFVARTFALIATVQPVLHQISCSNETIQNAPNHYETLQYMSLVSNGVGRVHSLWIIPKWLHGTNLCINCTSSTRFAPSFVQKRNKSKLHQTIRNKPIFEFRVQWGGSGAFVAKNYDATSWHKLLH